MVTHVSNVLQISRVRDVAKDSYEDLVWKVQYITSSKCCWSVETPKDALWSGGVHLRGKRWLSGQ